jgi:hypothetical protein
MPKAIEKVPETVAELKTTLPELCAQLESDAKMSVDVQGQAAAARTEERDRILGLVTVEFGDEAGAKFQALVSTGVTVDQLKAIKAMNPPVTVTAIPGQDAEARAKQEILDALKKTGAENPGAGGNERPKAVGKNFLTLVKTYQDEYGVKRSVAIKETIAAHPDAHAAYLAEANPKKEG